MLNRKPVISFIEDDENMNAANRQLLEREGCAVRVGRGLAVARALQGGVRESIGKPCRLDELCRKMKTMAAER